MTCTRIGNTIVCTATITEHRIRGRRVCIE
jgi:hypothetical protein